MNTTQHFEMNTAERLALIPFETGDVHVAAGHVAALPAQAVEKQFDRGILIDDVCDLIAAAGPLAPNDIAGGLNASISAVWTRIRSMLDLGALREDEFGRYRLAGRCPEGAA